MTNSNQLVAVLCEDVERRQGLLAALSGCGLDARACATSEELHRLAVSTLIDAVVLEQRLQGFFSGIEILSRLAQDLVRPASVLIGTPSATEKQRAEPLQVDVTLDHEASVETIANTVQQVLRATKAVRVGISVAARMLVRDARIVQPLPQVILRLAELLKNPGASAAKLTKEVSNDPRIAAELLRIVNGSASGVGRRVTRVQDAVSLLGNKKTVALALSTTMLDHGVRTKRKLPLSLDQRLRVRFVLTAAAASTFAMITGHESPEIVQVLGLVQDLGMLVMAHEIGAKYHQVLMRCGTISQIQLHAFERREFGFTHADVSAALLQKWDFPPELLQLVQLHHSDHVDDLDSATDRACLQAMQIGEAVADMKEMATPQRRIRLQRLMDRFGKGDEDFARTCLMQSVAKARDMLQVFRVPVPNAGRLDELIEQVVTTVDQAASESDAANDSANDAVEVPDLGGLHVSPLNDSVSGTRQPRVRVLVLDDEPQILHFIEDLLEDSEFSVETFTDPELAWTRAARVDVLLVDWHLPPASGRDFIRRVREAGIGVPVLIVSGDCSRQTVLESIRVGANDYIPKPFGGDVLFSKLRAQVMSAVET